MKFHIITLGCVLNKSDSQRMEYLLKNSGFEYSKNPEDAEILIINTCTVKTPAENKVLRLIKKYQDKKIVLAGCLVEHRKDLLDSVFKQYPVVGVYNIDRIVDVVRQYLDGMRTIYIGKKKIDKLSIPSIDKYPIKIIPIQEGCLWKCKYCATKFSRGLLQSFPPRRIYSEIESAVKNNLRIIHLTGTDLSVYGVDLGLDLADLLKGISNLNGLFFIRVGMANPGILNKYLNKLLDSYQDPRIFKFFHIPVQSGSNKVLESMGREYTIEEFIEIVQKIRERYPNATIATDIIVGYPTETDEDFEKTIEMIYDLGFDVINISKFWPRKFTEAEKMKQLPGWKIKERSRKVTKAFNDVASQRNKKWVGWEGWAIVEEKGRKEDSWIARNYAYKQIVVKSSENLLGKFVRVRITNYTAVDIRGKLLKVSDEIDISEWWN